MKKYRRNCRGFTLIELIIVLVILSILAAISIPLYLNYVNNSKVTADNATLKVLNNVTAAYQAEEPSPNAFQIVGTSDSALMETLVSNGLLSGAVEPQQEDYVFTWSFSQQEWLLATATHTLFAEEARMGNGGFTGYLTSASFGDDTDIEIPTTIDGTTVTHIYQDVFNGKGLTSVVFSEDSGVTRIHARAFKNNDLTEVTLPDSLTRIDYGAFMDNDITTVTIGSGVTLESNVFQNNNKFRDAYYEQGAGTYQYIDGEWVKQ